MHRTLGAGSALGAIGDDVGRVAAITGITALLAVVALVLLFTVGSPFGTANDLFNASIGVLSVILAIQVHRTHGGSVAALLLVVAGAALTVLGSWLVTSGTTGFQLAGFVSAIGFALIGAWLVVAAGSQGFGGVMPPLLSKLGLVAGAVMLAGMIGVVGVLLRIDSAADTPWWLWLYGLGWLGTYILFPAWCLLLWRAGNSAAFP